MRVLYIVDYWQTLGGIETVCGHVALSLLRLGLELEVWTVRESGSPVREGIAARGLAPSGRLLRSAHARFQWRRDLSSRLRKQGGRFDICIVGHVGLLGPVLEGLDRSRTECWLWIYGLEVWGHAGAARCHEISQVDRVISISRFTASHIASCLGESRPEIVPCAVDATIFSPASSERELHRSEVLIVGRLSSQERYKGHDVLLEALPEMEGADGEPARLVVIGDGDDRARLETRSAELGLEDRVEFRGKVSIAELVASYRRCSVFAMPSRVESSPTELWKGEGFGLVYLEAAACGRPVVASTDGGAPEAVRAGETGLLADPRDPRAVADAISILLHDPERAISMGRRGRKWVEAEFSLPRFEERIRDLLP